MLFEAGMPAGKRVYIVGESHYEKEAANKRNIDGYLCKVSGLEQCLEKSFPGGEDNYSEEVIDFRLASAYELVHEIIKNLRIQNSIRTSVFDSLSKIVKGFPNDEKDKRFRQMHSHLESLKHWLTQEDLAKTQGQEHDACEARKSQDRVLHLMLQDPLEQVSQGWKIRDKDLASELRSKFMLQAANQYMDEKIMVWKVGDAHVQHMISGAVDVIPAEHVQFISMEEMDRYRRECARKVATHGVEHKWALEGITEEELKSLCKEYS